MQVRFWGTRGSLAKPGRHTLRFGGNTVCVEVRAADGTLLIIDCGTGIQDLGLSLMATADRPLHGNILISHTHWDHIQGFPFFTPLFVKENTWNVYGPRGLGQSLRETLAGQMEYTYFPITLESLGSSISFHDLVEGAFRIGDVVIRTQYLNHPALTLGYRIEADGVVLVYASDHEPYLKGAAAGTGAFGEQDLRHADFLEGADLVIHDAQYTLAEYPSKLGWGHSTVEYAASVCKLANVRRLALTHHDPQRTDEAVERLEKDLKASLSGSNSPLEVFAAAEGMIIELSASRPFEPAEVGAFSAATPVVPAIWQHAILIGATDGDKARQLSEAASSEGIPAKVAETADAFFQLVKATRPSVIILEEEFARQVAAGFRSAAHESIGDDIPVVAVSHSETPDLEFVTDWLIEPFSNEYLRTRMRAWVLRNACRWHRAQLPENEDRRIAGLRQLGILDTDTEERFDRITRLAAALFEVPVSLVTLIDEDRQWFKSCYGYDKRETSRDEAFCSHAILKPEVMVVPDTLLDDRFADHPAVREQPRLRFYAGYPLTVTEGVRVGTLCILDTRPREFDAESMSLLRDLGAIVERELAART